MFWKRLLTFFGLLLIGLVFVAATAPEWPAFQDERHKLNAILGQRHFDFLVWEANAVAAKGEAALTAGHAYLDEESRKQLVLDYLALLQEVRGLEAEIASIYANPDLTDPSGTSRELQREVDDKRALLTQWQPVAEATMQEQVAAVLVDEGFGLFGQIWPPVLMHMTPLPHILIVSPREEIRQIYNIPLQHGLTVATHEDIETAVLDTVDRSALVVPIGGLGLYPAMIVETSSVNFLSDVTAHEWTHHYLAFHPLGLSYAASPELRTINETVASIVGEEIGKSVIERFYPEFVPQAADPDTNLPETDSEAPALFDFNGEMAKTRIRVDELLAEGRVEEAESYMEERRQFLWENGYRIRKLNQAYFAFYGAYADTPGEAGDDPIGPAVVAIRESSPSLRVFMDRVASISSVEELQSVAAESSKWQANHAVQ